MDFDPDSGFPMDEHVCARSARGDFFASNWRRKTKEKQKGIKTRRTSKGGEKD